MKNTNRFKNWLFQKSTLIQIWILSIPKRNWVSYHAQKLIKKSQRQDKIPFPERIFEKWFTWMHPARWRISLILALAVVILPQLLAGLLLYVKLIPIDLFDFLDADFLSITWQVLASIIGISFVIVVFLTEYSQDRSYERRAFPIYVSGTSMIFTVMVGLLTLMSMGINLALWKLGSVEPAWILGASLWNSSLFLINLLLTLILYIRTYQLLSPSYFRKILINYHRRKVLERVYQELFKRVKQNMSIHFIEGLGIKPSLWRSDFPGRTGIKIKENIDESHVVIDVNLDLISLASKNAKKLLKDLQRDKFLFIGLPGRTLSKDYPEIASVIPELNQNEVVLPLKKAIRTIPWKSSKFESASDDLLINRDLVSTAIASGQYENVESSLNLYIETIKAFLDALKQLGYRFTSELAEKESNWFNRWDIFDTVHHQYVSLLKEALRSNQSEIISEFVGFPSQVMIEAFQYRDHFAFRRFANLYSLIYTLTRRHISDEAANQIVDRCGRLLVQFSHIWIETRLTKNDILEDEVKELIAYGGYILNVLNQLAKYQIDYRDAEYYQLTIGSIQRLFNDFCQKHDEYSIEQLEMEFEYAAEELTKANLGLQLQKAKELNSLSKKLRTDRQIIFIGLGTWICHLLDKGQLSSDTFEKFIEPLRRNFPDLNKLHEAYSYSFDYDRRDQFDWRSWEMDEWSDEAYGEGRFGTIHFYSWISLYYTFRALELTPENPDSIPEIKPAPNIKGTLDSIKADFKHLLENKNWEPVINKLGKFDVRASILEKAHEMAYENQSEIEEIEVVQTPLSDKKIKDFYKEMEEEWQKLGSGRKLFITFGRYAPRADAVPPKELIPFGVHTRTPKGVFIENAQIGYAGWGRSFGDSMARGENHHISATYQKLPSISANFENFDNVISDTISSLRSKGLNPIVLYGHKLHRQFFESKHYEPRWKTTKAGPKGLDFLDGFYSDAAIFRFPVSPNSVVIYDPAEFGELVQYKVDEDKPDFPLSFSVKEISRERAKGFLVNHPELAKHPDTGEKLSEEEALRRIQQDVELTIWQRIAVENINPKSGVVINFGDADNEEKTIEES